MSQLNSSPFLSYTKISAFPFFSFLYPSKQISPDLEKTGEKVSKCAP